MALWNVLKHVLSVIGILIVYTIPTLYVLEKTKVAINFIILMLLFGLGYHLIIIFYLIYFIFK